MKLSAVLDIAGRQHGCVTWGQALQVMSRRQFDGLADKGIIRKVMPSVYVVMGMSDTWEQRAFAAVLSADGAALSHRSAARFWGLSVVASERIAITVPDEGPKIRDGLRLHRSMQLEPFVVMHKGLRVTNVARTLVDLSSCASLENLADAVDQACNKNLIKLEEIQHCLDAMITKGRSRITRLREVLAVRNVTDEKLDSFLERRTLKWIRESGLPEPEGQYRLLANGSAYRLDLCYPDLKIAVEPDGPHHLLSSIAAYDRKRDADLALSGWLVRHVLLETKPHEVLSFLRSAIQQRQQIPITPRIGA